MLPGMQPTHLVCDSVAACAQQLLDLILAGQQVAPLVVRLACMRLGRLHKLLYGVCAGTHMQTAPTAGGRAVYSFVCCTLPARHLTAHLAAAEAGTRPAGLRTGSVSWAQ